MTDFSPELLGARERLLNSVVLTWPIKVAAVPAPLLRPAYPITVEALASVIERYRVQWQEALAEKDTIVASGTAGKVDGYWKREHRARALYATSLALLEALSDDT
jgi:hypothetical protein